MEQMLAIVFNNEKDALTAKAALRDIVLKRHITVYGGALIVRHPDGTVAVRDFDDFGVGTAVGSLIALLDTPKGLLAGSRSFAVGAAFDDDDLEIARVGRDFIDDVSAAMIARKFAIVAEIDEDWSTPVDTEIESAGGIIFRCELRPVRDHIHDAKIAAMKADLAQLEQEASISRCQSRAKLQMRIEHLRARIDARQKEVKGRRDSFEARRKAKRERLDKNSAAARH